MLKYDKVLTTTIVVNGQPTQLQTKLACNMFNNNGYIVLINSDAKVGTRLMKGITFGMSVDLIDVCEAFHEVWCNAYVNNNDITLLAEQFISTSNRN